MGDTAEPGLPPPRSRGILSDLSGFLLGRPAIPTRIRFDSEEERRKYQERIVQRLGVHVGGYAVLNIHRIGIEAPVRYVFEELLRWDGDSTCWPNHIAAVDRIDGRLEHIRILLLGLRRAPLFDLNALRIQRVPDPTFDNARYLLYGSNGGYPVGVFCIYARSAIAERREVEQTQLFSLVGFNFYGRKKRSSLGPINLLWEAVHNRVTANVMNRFKQLCEWQFRRVQAGERAFS